MPSAKPRYGDNGAWKYPQFKPNTGEWDTVINQAQQELRPFYPDKQAKICPYFGHPADQWAMTLLDAAYGAIVMELWNNRRLTKETLRAEIKKMQAVLNKEGKYQKKLSHDLIVLFGENLLDTYNIDKKSIPQVNSGLTRVTQLPRAMKTQDAQHQAAIQMIISVSDILEESGIPLFATAVKDLERYSDAVKILKILGDLLKLRLAETTWKDAIIKAKKIKKQKQI